MAKSEDKADVWMPLYIGDYLADTSRLTTEQHGAYLLLLMDYWRNGPPPDDEEILQNITRLSKFLWKKHGPILRKFFTVEEGVWKHKRIDEEMTKALSDKALASEKGKKGAEARWGKKDATGNAQALPDEWPSSSPSPSPIPTTTSTGQSIVVGAKARASDDSIPKNEAEWLRHLSANHGVVADPTSVHDRKRYWTTFAAWVNAGVSTAQVDAAISKAYREATEPISNIVAYASRVLDSMTAPTQSRPRSYHDERADTIAGLTGRSRNHEPDDERIIDVTATTVARLAG
jgi:uncharacterized protein YdaU (DUF1376 family)